VIVTKQQNTEKSIQDNNREKNLTKRSMMSSSTKPLKKRRHAYDFDSQIYCKNETYSSSHHVDLSILAALASHQYQLQQNKSQATQANPLYFLPVIHTTPMYNNYIEKSKIGGDKVQSIDTTIRSCVGGIQNKQPQCKKIHECKSEASITMPLSHPEDKEKLSRLQCFLREQIEIFIATAEDATTYSRGRNKRVEVGQAGIRCKHCSTLPVKDRSKGSTYFPSTLTGIYQAAQNMYHYHFCTGCPIIAQKYPTHFNEVLSSRSCYGGGKDYWSMAAERMGLTETVVGLKLKNNSTNYMDDDDQSSSNTEVDQSSLRELELAAKDTSNIVKPEDRCFITDYTFMLFSQMFPCYPAKRTTESSLPGLVCKHCEGCNGNGAFFRTKVSSLSKNENLAQIDKHLRECRYCPDTIKAALKNLKEIHSMQTRRLKRGHKKAFFSQMMTRISSQPSNIRTHLSLDC